MAKKKVLFVATVDSHIELFHVPYLKMFHDKGWEIMLKTKKKNLMFRRFGVVFNG